MSYSVITRCLCLGDKNRPYSGSSILKGRVQTKSRCWFLLKALRTLALVSARVLELVRPSWTGASHPLQRAVPGALLCHVIYKMLNTEHYEHSKKKHLMGPWSLQEFPVVILMIFTHLFMLHINNALWPKRPFRKPLRNAPESESHSSSAPMLSRLARGDHRWH